MTTFGKRGRHMLHPRLSFLGNHSEEEKLASKVINCGVLSEVSPMKREGSRVAEGKNSSYHTFTVAFILISQGALNHGCPFNTVLN